MAIDLTGLRPEQHQIATTLDGPLFVSAGAGSGKTFTLTKRILWALSPASGPFASSLDEILAITFTKDAAAEIRERVRRALIDAGMEEQARSVDGAWISTIHGMCARILRAHALERGIDPAFTVIEDTSELIERAFARALAAAGVDAGAPHAGAGSHYAELFSWYPVMGEVDPDGRESGTSVHRIVLRLIDLAGTLPHGIDDIDLARGTLDLSGLADACRAFQLDFPGTKGAEQAAATLAATERFTAGHATPRTVAELLCSLELPTARGKAKQAATLLKAEAADALINAYVAVSSAATDELLDFARAVDGAFRELKREAGVLDNNDLLLLTYQALAEDPQIRAAYAHQFKMVMIDEFQDTDQLQVDLIGFLAGEGSRALCTVGDAQQSIYRFRGADVEVFRTQERAIATRAGEGEGGHLVKLVRNFRSHAQILQYVSQVFDDARGGIMPGFLDLEAHDGRADGLKVPAASRRQALLVVGGTREERVREQARAIAERFAALARAGQPVGDMVLLLGRMTNADVYAAAMRAAGLDCVIAGGSVFSEAPEVKAVRALVCALANPADTAQGLAPLLASPVFALGVEEFLALATAYTDETGETARRNLERGIDPAAADAPGLAGLPLVKRAREVLGRAFARVGVDAVSDIARDVVVESGWLNRLEAKGPEGRAVAANVLKALDALVSIEAEGAAGPRAVALAFDRFLAGKQAPGALNAEGGDAVRIMTVHASKGLEFPVVAVVECYGSQPVRGVFQSCRTAAGVRVCALPSRFPAVRDTSGARVDGDEVAKRFRRLYNEWLPAELVDDVCASGSVAETFVRMRADEAARQLEERSRLLYVAMTRAREVLILAMESGLTSRKKQPTLVFDDETDLTGRVLERILPAWPALDADRLVFPEARPGDFELIALTGFQFEGLSFEATVPADGGEGEASPLSAGESCTGTVATVSPANAAGDTAPFASGTDDAVPRCEDTEPLDTFTLVYPAPSAYRRVTAAPPARDSYSYTSIARALGAHDDNDAEKGAAVTPVPDEREPRATDDPTALGSAFHAAAQWMIETGSDEVPVARIDALCRFWQVSPAQRERLERALARWRASASRRELLAWPCVRAEVPFFSLGSEDLRERFGAYAEGAIDALGTDPADLSNALVIDYKTGGSSAETEDVLQRKHELQARIYADVLHRAGYGRVSLRFVRVEIDDPAAPGTPQVVRYEL